MARRTGLRSVVRTVRRLVVEVFGGETQDEIKPLNVNVVPDQIEPVVDETIPVEVGGLGHGASSATIFAPREAFDVDEDEGTVAVADGFEDRLAEPRAVMDFENPHMHGKLMHFGTADVGLPNDPVERREVSLGLGVFPDGPGSTISLDRWDSDRVTIPPRGADN